MEQMAESLNFIPMNRIQVQNAERFAAELRERLKDRLAGAEVNILAGGISVLTPVDSREEAATATATVRDCVRGVNQAFALDPLDEGRRSGIVLEGTITEEYHEVAT